MQSPYLWRNRGQGGTQGPRPGCAINAAVEACATSGHLSCRATSLGSGISAPEPGWRPPLTATAYSFSGHTRPYAKGEGPPGGADVGSPEAGREDMQEYGGWAAAPRGEGEFCGVTEDFHGRDSRIKGLVGQR